MINLENNGGKNLNGVDLSLVLLTDIISELERRFDGFTVITLKNCNAREDQYGVYYHGGKVIALGLFEWGKNVILEDININSGMT